MRDAGDDASPLGVQRRSNIRDKEIRSDSDANIAFRIARTDTSMLNKSQESPFLLFRKRGMLKPTERTQCDHLEHWHRIANDLISIIDVPFCRLRIRDQLVCEAPKACQVLIE